MGNNMESFRTLLIGTVTGIAAYLNPVSGDMYSMLAVFAVNFMAGLLTDLLANGGSFSFRKAWRCVGEATVFFVLVCAIYFIGERHGDAQAALQCVSFVTYSVFYFYTVNVLRNLKTLLPEASVGYRVTAWLHWAVSAEFVKRIPGLQEYLGINPNRNGKEADDGQ